MKTCAICGKAVLPTYQLCGKCLIYRDEPWARELIKIENHNYYMNYRCDREISFTDNGMDIQGERIVEPETLDSSYS